MKRIVSVLLAVALAFGVTPAVSAASGDRIDGINDLVPLGSSGTLLNGSYADFNNLFISSNDTLRIILSPDMFTWQNGSAPLGTSGDPLTLDNLTGLSVKAIFNEGAEYFMPPYINYDRGTGRCYIQMKSRSGITLTNDVDFDGKIAITFKGLKSEIDLAGFVGNKEVRVYSGDVAVWVQYNQYIKANAFIDNLEVNFETDDVRAYIKVFGAKKYYIYIEHPMAFGAEQSFWDKFGGRDSYESIDGVYHAYYSDSVNTASTYVEFDLYKTSYVYDKDANYLGTTAQKLPLKSSYLLFNKKLSIPIATNSSDSGSSSGGGGNGALAPSNTPQPVTVADATSAVRAALQTMETVGGTSASAKLKNPSAITLEVLQAMAKAAGSTPLTVNADSMTEDGKAVNVRLSFNPAKATKSVDLSASTTTQRAQSTKAFFEKWFSNKVMVISCTQQGDFGMDVEIAAKIDPALNTKAIIFYTYDKSTNSYKQIIPTPKYWIDTTGYIHFATNLAGNIIITDSLFKRNNLKKRRWNQSGGVFFTGWQFIFLAPDKNVIPAGSRVAPCHLRQYSFLTGESHQLIPLLCAGHQQSYHLPPSPPLFAGLISPAFRQAVSPESWGRWILKPRLLYTFAFAAGLSASCGTKSQK